MPNPGTSRPQRGLRLREYASSVGKGWWFVVGGILALASTHEQLLALPAFVSIPLLFLGVVAGQYLPWRKAVEERDSLRREAAVARTAAAPADVRDRLQRMWPHVRSKIEELAQRGEALKQAPFNDSNLREWREDALVFLRRTLGHDVAHSFYEAADRNAHDTDPLPEYEPRSSWLFDVHVRNLRRVARFKGPSDLVPHLDLPGWEQAELLAEVRQMLRNLLNEGERLLPADQHASPVRTPFVRFNERMLRFCDAALVGPVRERCCRLIRHEDSHIAEHRLTGLIVRELDPVARDLKGADVNPEFDPLQWMG